MKKEQTYSHSVIAELAKIYPQLYLDPDTHSKEEYREVVLKGKKPAVCDLSFFRGDERDKDEMTDIPSGQVRVITLYGRRDYEKFIRCMMAAREGPENQIPASQGASTLITFNWTKINQHKEQFFKEQFAAGNKDPDWQEEWNRFSAVKENYMDTIVVLSVGPYSNIDADRMGYSKDEWLEYSNIIRKYHELTHVICRKEYPDQINAIWDELVADAIGLCAAYHSYDPDIERVFLGITDGRYTGGRLENYTDDPQGIAPKADRALKGIAEIIQDHPKAEPFSLIPFIQARQNEFF